jgi:predicted TIM-barrel fold metal-dependent hydrolase
MNSRPKIDAHNHLGRWLGPDGRWVEADLAGGARGLPWTVADVGALLDTMDRRGVVTIVNLDGRWDDELEANLDRYDRAHPGRFATFCQLDWSLARHDDDFATALVASLTRSAAAGARGLKVWKTLGLGWRDARGAMLLPDDARIAPVWEAAGALGLPVLIHTADPAAFFEPLDERNPWREELLANPDWHVRGEPYPPLARLLDAFEAMVASHPRTTFIGAHLVAVEDLAWVARLCGAYPNVHVDVSARLAQLAAQPEATRRLLGAHPDRVLFGTDEFPPGEHHYDEWDAFLASLELEPAVLRAIVHDNAHRLLAQPSAGAV